jgi:hypothetical protein
VAEVGKVVAGSVPERDEKRGAGERKIRPAADGSALLGGGCSLSVAISYINHVDKKGKQIFDALLFLTYPMYVVVTQW